MIFSTSILEKAEQTPFPKSEEIVNEEFDFFEEALEIMMENNVSFDKMIFKDNIVGQDMNNLKQIDGMDALISILSWFESSYVQLGTQFINHLEFTKSEAKDISKYQDKLDRFNGLIRYNKKYYIFRNIFMKDATIKTSYYDEIKLKLDTLNSNLQELYMNGPIGLATELSNKNQNDEFELNNIRSRIVGQSGEVPKEDFSKAAFNMYRLEKKALEDDKLNKDTVHNLGDVEVQNASKSYFHLENEQELINRELHTMRFKINALKKMVKDCKYNEHTIKYNDENSILVYNAIYRDAIFKVKEICQLYIAVLGARLDAFKDYNKQCRNILDIAIKVEEGDKNDK